MTKNKMPAGLAKLASIILFLLGGSMLWFSTSASSSSISPVYSVSITAIGRGSNSVVYHAPSNRIFASIPSGTDSIGNSVSEMDPESGGIEQSVWVGSEPDKLVLTSNGQ